MSAFNRVLLYKILFGAGFKLAHRLYLIRNEMNTATINSTNSLNNLLQKQEDCTLKSLQKLHINLYDAPFHNFNMIIYIFNLFMMLGFIHNKLRQ